MTTADIINNDFTATIFVFVIVSILSQKSDFCFVLVFGLSSFMSLVWVPFGRVGLQSYQILIGYLPKLSPLYTPGHLQIRKLGHTCTPSHRAAKSSTDY